MNFGTEMMLQQICGFGELDSVSTAEIEAACARYPYFAPLQLLLAYRYRQQSNAYFTDQAEKTSVYFSNWYWLNELLEGKVTFSMPDEAAASSQTVALSAQPIDPAITLETVEESQGASVSSYPVNMSAEPSGGADETETSGETPEAVIAERDATAEPATDTAIQQVIVEEALKEEPTQALPELSGEIIKSLIEEPHTPAALNEEPSIEAPAENEVDVKTDEHKEEEVTDSDQAETAEVESEEEAETFDPQQELTVLPGIEDMKQNIGLLKNVLSDIDSGSAPLIPIEPLHTIDYFASQGIKLKDLGIEPTDQLGRKLKSFTEWLKTMKKLHPEKLGNNIDDKSQSSIQHMAEHSNTAGEVLTESIAEVYARQGLKEKATEVYLKLSLQNPSKSTYFAAKISKLNEL